MTTFGKRGGGGRRRARRAAALLPATVMTVARSRGVVLLNVSSTGARLRGQDLPATGDDLVLRIDSLETFGTVMWNRQDLCGIAFDKPITEGQVERLRAEAGRAMLTKLTPEERLAMEDWNIGLAR